MRGLPTTKGLLNRRQIPALGMRQGRRAWIEIVPARQSHGLVVVAVERPAVDEPATAIGV